MTAPLRFALVQIEPTEAMDSAAELALCGSIGGYEHTCWRSAYDAAMLAASPGNDLLERIVTELNSAHALALNTGYRQSADRIHALLNELGGGHG